MNRQLFSLAVAAVSLAAAPLAFAQSKPNNPPAEPQQEVPATPAPTTGMAPKQISWSQLDADGNGKLSKTEAMPVNSLSQAFDSADTDKDGALTADEYKTYLAHQQHSPAPATPPTE